MPFDGEKVVGSIGKQKELYTQQIDSYKKDAELKAAKKYQAYADKIAGKAKKTSKQSVKISEIFPGVEIMKITGKRKMCLCSVLVILLWLKNKFEFINTLLSSKFILCFVSSALFQYAIDNIIRHFKIRIKISSVFIG